MKKWKQYLKESQSKILNEFNKKDETLVMDDESLEKVTGAFLEHLKDYRAAITDTFIQTAKQVYKKEFFDRFAESGLKSGVLYRSIDEAIAKGVPNASNLRPVVADLNPIFFFYFLISFNSPFTSRGYFS